MTNWQLALYVCSAIVAGIITKSTAGAALKALALFVVTAIVTVLAAWTTTGAWDADLIRDQLLGVAIAAGSYTGFWRPLGIRNLFPAFGFGSADDTPIGPSPVPED